MIWLVVCLLGLVLVRRSSPSLSQPQSNGPPIAERLVGWVLYRFRSKPRDGTQRFCQALVAELQAGAPPPVALLTAGEQYPVAPRAMAAARLQAPIHPALRADGEAAQAIALIGLAACWEVAAESGAGLIAGIQQVETIAAAEEQVTQDLEQELASPRATGRVLMFLPLVGIGLGELMGASPASWLVGTGIGRAIGVFGLILMAAGWWWTTKIMTAALPDRRL